MEQFQACRDKARELIKVADHMFVITYPLVKDPKLLVAIIDKVFQALDNSISSLLYLERMLKRIGPFADTFESKFNLFRAELAQRYNIDRELVKFLQEMMEIMKEHQKSPVEFVRKDRFVICSENYQLRSLSSDAVKRHIAKAKKFIQEIECVVNKNDRIFHRVSD